MKSSIAEKLIALRKQNGLTLDELAEKLGVDVQIAAGWETGDISPDTEQLLKIAKLYRISLDKLFNIEVDGTGQRSGISLEKERNEINNESGFRENAENTQDRTVYDEPQDMNAYFNYETADGSNLPAAGSFSGKPSAGIKNEIADTVNRIQKDRKFYRQLMKFPYPVLATTAFFAAGGLLNLWHPAWMIFLTIPLYYTTIQAIYKKNANIFCYPVFVTLLYLIAGFALNLWHPGWLSFLTIPLYYWIVNTFDNKDDEGMDEHSEKAE